jgi:hypothetical protein
MLSQLQNSAMLEKLKQLSLMAELAQIYTGPDERESLVTDTSQFSIGVECFQTLLCYNFCIKTILLIVRTCI